MKYFIGNWKMFGIPKSVKILKKINSFHSKDQNKNKYKVIITPPYTLLNNFSKYFKKSKIIIGSQNCFHKDPFSSNTAAVSPFMIRSVGAKYVIVGHSDNRSEGDTHQILKMKVDLVLKNKMKVIFCIGEDKIVKKNKKTFQVLKSQLTNSLESYFNPKNIIIAYEPIWSIGTGQIPSEKELKLTTIYIKKVLRQFFKKKCPPVLYGGSVDNKNISMLCKIKEIDGFLIGGASKSSKKFIDIIKNYYRY